jgi:hypothetical protein
MFGSNWIRYVVGFVLGAAAGLSLAATVFPMVLSQAGLDEEFLIHLALRGYVAPCMLAFAIGSALTARVGAPKTGALLLGGIGLACGVVPALIVYGGEAQWLLPMAGYGGAFGATAGLVFGHMLKKPAE